MQMTCTSYRKSIKSTHLQGFLCFDGSIPKRKILTDDDNYKHEDMGGHDDFSGIRSRNDYVFIVRTYSDSCIELIARRGTLFSEEEDLEGISDICSRTLSWYSGQGPYERRWRHILHPL